MSDRSLLQISVELGVPLADVESVYRVIAWNPGLRRAITIGPVDPFAAPDARTVVNQDGFDQIVEVIAKPRETVIFTVMVTETRQRCVDVSLSVAAGTRGERPQAARARETAVTTTSEWSTPEVATQIVCWRGKGS